MRTPVLRTAAAVAVLAALSFPHDSASQTCVDPAARNLLVGAYADAVVNPPDQEDNQFFTNSGGIPNIYFLMDTGVSMGRLPPNGPLSLGPVPTGTAGCATDPASGGLDPVGASTILAVLGARYYHSPCGPAYVRAAVENQPYQAGVDYFQEATVCPYYTQGNNAFVSPSTGGYDPDWPAYFAKDSVYHGFGAESLGTWARDPNATPACAPNNGSGWGFGGVFPYTLATVQGNKCTGAVASIDQFCADQGANSTVCAQCLKTRGWFYDGTAITGTYDGVVGVQYPSVWYTGNYLSFFPPKFVVARKLVKDVIGLQARVRMAAAGLSPTGFQPAPNPGDQFGPVCSQIFNNNANWDSSRSTVVKSIDGLTWGETSKRLSQALFDVGRYYHTPTLTWFGPAWSAPTWPSAVLSDSSSQQAAVCWSCQVSAVIMLTDGVTNAADGTSLPPGTASLADSNTGKFAGDPSTGILGADCNNCSLLTGADSYLNNLIRVAFYMHNYDLRNEAAGTCGGTGTADGKGMPGKQVLDVYTVGFATGGQNSSPAAALKAAAREGGGTNILAEAADQLRWGIYRTFQEINTRSTSFSVATVSTLQTTTGHSVIVPRFEPSKESHWAGHLSRYELYSEFVNACTPNGPGDLDCDGQCSSVFLTDKNGKFIGEDGNGSFVLTTDGKPPCSQTPLCGSCAGAGNIGNVPASPWWDAYNALQAMGWKDRFVWTVTDSNGDGKLDASDAMVRLDTSDVTADELVPYLGLGTTAPNGGVCPDLAGQIEAAGDLATGAAIRTSKRACAKSIIRWLLGADVLNEVGRTPAQGWPPPRPDMNSPPSATNLPDQDQLLDRKFKLGDIYHSSPVEVSPPLPSDGILCPNGLSNQCLGSLWMTPVKHVGNVNQYDLYSKSSAYQYRRRMILVGANDGQLHAFNGGRWHPNEDDPVTAGLDESKAPFNGYYDRGELDPLTGTSVSPQELWAFVPPDLLGKIPTLLASNRLHQFFVDGTAQVRDVWVDGTDNGLSPAGSLDGLKAASEFHTVAVIGERRGGTHYFALDLTKATHLTSESGDHRPGFLWIYPQPNDPESLTFGETYDDFLPTPPPVGPVRIKADDKAELYGLAPATNAPSVYTPEDPLNAVKYHELWVVMLPGGFDPGYQRGRGVHMVDVWRGKEVFDFSYPSDPTVPWYDPRKSLQWPVAATPGMVMWGTQARRIASDLVNDGYFDTATFGDTGGQLWVLRFNRPGTMGVDGRATNWFGGRIFSHGYQLWGDLSQCNPYVGNPFYYITANTALPGSRVFRVYAGTGDRFNLLDTNGGNCGPDNLRACAQKGCAVSQPIASNVRAATGAGYLGRGTDQPACPWTFSTRTDDTSSSAPTCGVTALEQLAVSACPNATAGTGFTKNVSVQCTPDAAGNYGCSTTSMAASNLTIDQSQNLSTNPLARNWYFSIKVFNDSGYRTIFDSYWGTAAVGGAVYYDYYHPVLYDYVWSVSPASSAAYAYDPAGTSGQLVVIDGASNNPSPLADTNSLGWAMYYNHGPQVTASDHVYSVNLLDERTSSVSGLAGKVTWNALQPSLGEATSAKQGCAQSKCQGAFYRVSYHYGADPTTGGPAFFDSSGNPMRAVVQSTLVPAQGDQPTVFVNQKGQIAVGLTAVNPEKGASNVGMGATMDPVTGLGVVEVSRQLHDCRHFVPAAGPGGTLTADERAYLTTKCKQ